MNDPLNQSYVDVTLDRHDAPCGGVVTGTFSWNNEKPPRSAHVSLRYETEGRGDTDRAEVTVANFAATASGQHRFQLRVPVNGPVTYAGDLIRIRWEVRGHLDVARQRDPDATVAVMITPRQSLQVPHDD